MRRLFLFFLLLLAACHGSDAKSVVGVDDGRIVKRSSTDAPVVGWLFASVAERTLGPFFTRRAGDDAGMTAWLTPAEGTFRTAHVVPVDAKGIPRAETIVAKVSIDTTMLVIGPVAGPTPGFALAWTSLTDRGKSLWSITVDDKGIPRGNAVELTRTNDDIVWIDVLPTEHGSLCMWAEETRGGDANLIAAPMSGDGRVHGAATRIAQGVIGWHALVMDHGLGVSTVSARPPDARPKPEGQSPIRDGKPGGFLFFRRLDAEAQQTQPPIAITPKSPTVSGDVEVTRVGKRLLFAWTDRSGEEPAVAMASLDDKDNIEPPRRVAEARGGASLLALDGGPAGAALMYEAPARRTGETRRIHVSRVNDGLTIERHPFSLEVVGRGQPELAATATGFALLATTPDCETDSAMCANAKSVATIMRTDAHGAVVQREPLLFGADPATLAWGLVCETETCFALAASPGTPSRIRVAAVRPRATTKSVATPAPPVAQKDGPRVVDVTAVASGESVVDIATAPLGTSTLVALLSAKADAAGKADERHTTSFILSTRVVGENAEASSPFIVTPRALGVGGIAIAPAATPEDGGALAWVSRESGDAEVHVTRLDKRGHRVADVQLTTAKGDASDVTITWANGGWIVAWVDWRDGNGEVYACRIGLDLARLSREERITRAPGDATDLAAVANGNDVWLAWGDSRESPRDGVADVFVSAVKMKDARRLFEEQRVLATAANSRTPHLASTSDGVDVAWIEDAPLGAETPGSSGYGAFWTRLSSDGKPTERPTRLALAGEGTATSVALEGVPLRAIVVRATLDSLSLDAIDLAKAPPTATTVLALDGPPSLDVALSMQPGGVVYFNDEGSTIADRRARRARIAWTR